MTTKKKAFISFSPPLIGEEEIAEVIDTLRSDWITTGPKVRHFEEKFICFTGAPAALAVNSATDAMLVGLAALGIGPGDEVITTPMTFCSTVHVIEHLGARPMLVDVEPDTLNINPDLVRRAVTPRTRAIMPVHLYGHPCEMDSVMEIARQHNLFVVEDAAHALPARYKGRMIGTIGTLTAFSFYATKNITTAEGGMLTGDPDLIDKARLWSLHGMSRDAYKRYSAEGSWHYEVVLPGFKCNMTDIQASLGLHQLKKLTAFQKRRREVVQAYNAAFQDIPELELPGERSEVESAWHLYVVRLNLDRLVIDRARYIEELKTRKIGTSVHFIPLHLHPYYRDKYGYGPEDLPIAYGNYKRIVTLPLHPRLSEEDVARIIGAVKEVATVFRRRKMWRLSSERSKKVKQSLDGTISIAFSRGKVRNGIPRAIETVLALGGLVVSSPLLFIAGLLIRSTSPGPVLFRQQRVGRFGKSFELLKFRSMRVGNGGAQVQVTAKGDSRVTRVGALLRKSKLDELPELWNVARGDLSLVGPRPEVPKYVNLEDPLWQQVLEARPGITDPVTLRLRNEEELLANCEGDYERFYLNTLQPYKLRGYVQYLRKRAWRSDMSVLLGTVLAIIFPAKTPPPRLEEIVEKLNPHS